MKKEVIGSCPICSHELKVTRLQCTNCGTALEGSFQLNKFMKLNKEQLYFLEVFVKNRGNIKEIEKELNISYPTVRNRLDSIIKALGYQTGPQKSIDRKSILKKLDAGDISTEEALKLLSGEEDKS
jgi:hypothetical protein